MTVYPFAFFWFTFWALTYMVGDDVVTSGNYLSLVFSTIVTICWPIIYINNMNPISLLELTYAYFLWDSIICLMFVDDFGWTMVFHAFLSLLGSSFSSVYPQHAFAFLMFEFSTVWLNLIRLKLFPRYQFYLNILFGLTFIIFRTLFGTYYTIYYIIPTTPWLVSILASLMVSLNFMWTYKLLIKAFIAASSYKAQTSTRTNSQKQRTVNPDHDVNA